MRVRTGYEKVIAHLCGKPFSTIASEDGIVDDVNEELQIIKLRYKTGREECISYANEFSNNSGQGFHVRQHLTVNNFKVGDKIKKGDVVVYNSDFFINNPYDKQVDMKLGVPANIAFIESTGNLDDASVISRNLQNKLRMKVGQEITLILTRDTQVYDCVEIGDEVLATDSLMTFDQNPIEEDGDQSGNDNLIEVLNTISRVRPKARFSGIVSNIKVYYKCSVSEMSKSLAQYVRKWIKLKNSRAKYANDNYHFPESKPLQSDKVGNILLTEDTVVIRFTIEQQHDVGDGDKIFVCSQNKSIISDIVDGTIMTEDGREVDIIHSAKGVDGRIVNSPYLTILTNEIFKTLQKEMVSMYFDD